MPLVRVYLPLDSATLAGLRTSGELAPAPVAAHAALPAVARPGLGNDEEDREYAAWSAAASDADSVAAQGNRRVIASADVDAAVVSRIDENGTAVEVGSAVPLPRIASFHIDEEAGGDVADLLWYDVTELDDVIALLG
ncbi:hypothetical protein N802_18325 [Knoellia sinensis KCTC 19936]|uniref:Uncharacterized protein n=1 Tax=Knoellia sinensis KCTC 19936 TaxID=1385520 RepID=A0A0A0J9N5_9MICO|nr:hypothetical protein [Knoellia sinensis]KGN32321.1 hypothetical protein N802_18325 [Knoellia sinensis KCTC 19936]